MGDSHDQAQERQKLEAWKAQLHFMLTSSIIPQRFSGKYPTKSGHLQMPYMKGQDNYNCKGSYKPGI